MEPPEKKEDSFKTGQALDSDMDSISSLPQPRSENVLKPVRNVNQSNATLESIIRKQGLIVEVSYPIEMIVEVSNLKASNMQNQHINEYGQQHETAVKEKEEEFVPIQQAFKENSTKNMTLLEDNKEEISNDPNLKLSDLPKSQLELQDNIHESQFNQECNTEQEEKTQNKASDSQFLEAKTFPITKGIQKQEEIIVETDASVSYSLADQHEPHSSAKEEQNVETETTIVYINNGKQSNQLKEVNEGPSNEKYDSIEEDEEETEEIIIIVSDSHEDMPIQYLQQTYHNQKNIILDSGVQEEEITDEGCVEETSVVEEVDQLEVQENTNQINRYPTAKNIIIEEIIVEPFKTKQLNIADESTYEYDHNRTTLEHDNNECYEVIILSSDLENLNKDQEHVQEKIFVELTTSAESDISQPESDESQGQGGILDKELDKVQSEYEDNISKILAQEDGIKEVSSEFQIQPTTPKIIIQNEIIFEAPKGQHSMLLKPQLQKKLDIENDKVETKTIEICESQASPKPDKGLVDIQNSLKDNSTIARVNLNNNQTRSIFGSFKSYSRSQRNLRSTKNKEAQTSTDLESKFIEKQCQSDLRSTKSKHTILKTKDELKEETHRPKMPLKARMKSKKDFSAEETVNNNNINLKYQNKDLPIQTKLKMPLKSQLKLGKEFTENVFIDNAQVELKPSKKTDTDEISTSNKPINQTESVSSIDTPETPKEKTEENLSVDETSEILLANYDKPLPTRYSQNLDDIFSKMQESGREMVTEEYLSEDDSSDEKEKSLENWIPFNAKTNNKPMANRKKYVCKLDVLDCENDQYSVSTRNVPNPDVSGYGSGRKNRLKHAPNQKGKRGPKPKPNLKQSADGPVDKLLGDVKSKKKLKFDDEKLAAQKKKNSPPKLEDLKEKIIENVKQKLLAENVTRLRNSKKILRSTKKQIMEVEEKSNHKRMKVDEKNRAMSVKEKNSNQRIKVREKLLSKQEMENVKRAFKKLKANKRKQFGDFLKKEKENVVEIKACDIGLPTVSYSQLKNNPNTRRKKLLQKIKDSKSNADINNVAKVMKLIPPRKKCLRIISNEVIYKSKQNLGHGNEKNSKSTSTNEVINKDKEDCSTIFSNKEKLKQSNKDINLTTIPQTTNLKTPTFSYRNSLQKGTPKVKANLDSLRKFGNKRKSASKDIFSMADINFKNIEALKTVVKELHKRPTKRLVLGVTAPLGDFDVLKYKERIAKALENENEIPTKTTRSNIIDGKELQPKTILKQVNNSAEKNGNNDLKLDIMGVEELPPMYSEEQIENCNTIDVETINPETVEEIEKSTIKTPRQYTRKKLKPNILDIHPWYSIEKTENLTTPVSESLNQKFEELQPIRSAEQVNYSTGLINITSRPKRRIIVSKKMQNFLKTCKKVVLIKNTKQKVVHPAMQKVLPPPRQEVVSSPRQEAGTPVSKDLVTSATKEFAAVVKNNKRRPSSGTEVKQEREERYWDNECNGNLSPLYDDFEENVPFISRDPAMLQKEDFEDEYPGTPLHSAFENQEDQAIVTITASDIGGDTSSEDEIKEPNDCNIEPLEDIKPPQPVEELKIPESKKNIKILSAKIIRRAPIYQDAAKADDDFEEASDEVYISRDPSMVFPKKEQKFDPYQFDEESCVGDEIVTADDFDDVFNELPRVIHNPKKRVSQRNSDKVAKTIPVFPCLKCLYIGKNIHSLERHKLLHMDPDDIVWHQCNQCNYKTKYKHSLKSHMLVHQEIKKTRPLKCHLCNYKAFKRLHLCKHFYRAHNISKDEQLYECYDCGKKFKNKASLTSHLNTMHSNLCEKCQYCNFVTLNQSTLASHIKTKHTKPERMYSCDQCQFQSKFPRDLDKHILRMHNRDKMKKFECSECPFSTIYKNNMRYHMNHVHNSRLDDKVLKQFICGHCMKVCNNKMALKTHIWQRHMALTDQSLFKCDKCDFKCKVQQNLKRHVFLKHEYKGTKCEKCDFTTTRTSSMIAHMAAHKREEKSRIYRCNECVYIAHTVSTMVYHMKKLHSKLVSAAELKQYLS